MTEPSRNPDRPDHLDELGEALRPAVEQVRATPVPAEAAGRAVERARRIGRKAPAQPWLRRHGHLLAVAGLAGLLVGGLALMPAPSADPRSAARTETVDLALLPEELRQQQSDVEVAAAALKDAAPRAKVATRGFSRLADADEEESDSPHPDPQPVRTGRANSPQRDSQRGAPAGTGRGPTVARRIYTVTSGDAGRAKKVTEEWGYLTPRERSKALEGLTRELSARDRQAMDGLLRRVQTGPATDATSRRNLARLEEARRRYQQMMQLRASSQNSVSADEFGVARLAMECCEREAVGDRQGAARKARELAEKRYEMMNRARQAAAVSAQDVRDAKKALDEAIKAERAVRAQVADSKGGKGKEKGEAAKPPEKKPAKPTEVWHQDRSRPSFARVYVGDGNSLELVSLHVSVTVEGPRARTLVDHVFRNPHDRRLEGTFEYPLPSGASPSYFAMFLGETRDTPPPLFAGRGEAPPLPAETLARLTPQQLVRQINSTDWGKFQEARVVAQDKAREAYEDVVRGQIDPALLEYAGGNTFRGRVFPIPPKGYNRVLLAYEETLPMVRERQMYRFQLPGRKLQELRFSLRARSADCRAAAFFPTEAKKEEKHGRRTYEHTWTDTAPTGEVRFVCVPPRPTVQATSGRDPQGGGRYLYARLRPRLPAVAKPAPFARHGVFLLDTSLSEHPDRFTVSMKLLRAILEGDPDLHHFNVLTFNAGAAWVEPNGWLPNTPTGRKTAFARLDGLLLEGATDLSAALDKLCAPGFKIDKGTPLSCFLLSDGNLTWGETDVPTLAARFERRCRYPTRFFCYRTGLGEENAELYDALARTGGGVFTCFGDADVRAAAQAHRRQCLEVQSARFAGGPVASDLLVAGRRSAVHPGGELIVAARFSATGRTRIVLEGTFQGEKVTQEFPVEVNDAGELAPRGWGEVAVANLLALHDPGRDPLVTAYCQRFNIASRAASFLVLENEADYKRLNLEAERGKTLQGDLGKFVEQNWALRGKEVSAKQAFTRLLEQTNQRTQVLNGAAGKRVGDLLALLGEDDFRLPTGTIAGGLLKEKDVPQEYLQGRQNDRRNVHPYLTESARRGKAGDADGAARVLSSVIEEHPGRGEALRLVGYRLLALSQPAQAARLFAAVQRQRPFEPHSYRDLARALEDAGKYGLAAVQYEAVLAGTWHNRFGDAIKGVVVEEYARMMQQAIRSGKLAARVANHFGERLEKMRQPQPRSDLRVTISWNTDATDVDLWVIEPDGTKVFYQAKTSKNGGQLSADMTQGYGPERYVAPKALAGEYTIIVHYYRANPNLLGGETHVDVSVTRNAGAANERQQRHTVILKKQGEQVEVCKVKF
jgi:hypothetical protein